MKTESEILLEARDLIAKPEHWTQGTSARDASGTPVISREDCATSFCMYGAISRAAGMHNIHKEVLATELRTTIHGPSIAEYNDAPNRKHEDVLAMMDATVARLKAAGR